MKGTKLIAGLAALAMCFGMAAALPPGSEAGTTSVTAFAEQHIWDGTADTSWYYKEHQYIYTGEGDNAKRLEVFNISTPEELAGLSQLVRNGVTMQDTYINLTDDIMLNDTSNYANWAAEAPQNNWIPVGVSSIYAPYSKDKGVAMGTDYAYKTFEGIFNGNGHTVSGMYCYHYSMAGLFGSISGDVSNVVVKDSYVLAENPCRYDVSCSWPVFAGGIVSYCQRGGIISGCEFDGSVKAIGKHYSAPGSLAYEINYIQSHQCAAGGIVGRIDDGDVGMVLGAILYTAVFGIQVYGLPTTPLIIGSYFNETNHAMGVFNCINHGSVSSEYGKSALGAGGIVGTGGLLGGTGAISPIAIYHCYSDGTATRADGNCGAMVGNCDYGPYSANNFKEIGCYYTNCERSSYPNEAVNYTNAGMTTEEVAEKLGDYFKAEGDTIYLDYAAMPVAEDLAEIHTDTFALPAEAPGTLDAPQLSSSIEDDSVKITWNKDTTYASWEYAIAADRDFTDCYEVGSYNNSSMYSSVNSIYFESLDLSTPYYIRVRGRTGDPSSESTQYTHWSYVTAGTIPPEPAPTEQTEPPTEQTEPSTEQTEPSTEQTEPSTEQTEPSTEQTEPSTEQPSARPQKLLAPCLSCYPTIYEEKPVLIFKWNRLDGITGYECQNSTDPTFADAKSFDESLDYTGVRYSNNTPGTTYYFRIRSFVETENGREYSEYATTHITAPAETETVELAAPVMLAPRLINDNKYLISWSAVSDADSYEIDTATDPAFEQCIRNDTEPAIQPNTERRWLEGFQKDQVYYYRIRAVKESENGKIYSDYTYINLMIPSAFELLHGDADSSTNVDASDAANILIEAAMVGSGENSTLTNMQSMAADVNGDGVINATDATAVLQYAAAVGAGQADARIEDYV